MNNTVILGYSEKELKKIKSNSIDLIITSPPYADRRKKTYGGIAVVNYIEWFKPIAIEIKRILKPTGSFFLNIKPHTTKGERELYVFELVLFLKKELGFMFIEEYCWTKNGFPGKLNGRFKNAFEPVYHFTKSSPSLIKFNPLACGHPVKKESLARANRKRSSAPANGSGMTAFNTDNHKKLKIARPSNVINVNNVSNQFTLKSKHSATFPVGLVDFFIKSFSDPGDLILDPFAGSGTVGLSCIDSGRKYILIDKVSENVDLINTRINRLIEKL